MREAIKRLAAPAALGRRWSAERGVNSSKEFEQNAFAEPRCNTDRKRI